VRARSASSPGQGSCGSEDLGATEFAGYDALEVSGAKVLRLASRASRGGPSLRRRTLGAGEEGVAVLDKTVFYAEAGGQVGDRRVIDLAPRRGRTVARGSPTSRRTRRVYFHFIRVEEGTLRQGQAVDLAVAPEHRLPTQRHHTATHLLHAALREVLGEGVRQAGSLVAPDRLRFDFTCPRPVAPEELRRIEDRVNDWVLRAVPTRIREMAYQGGRGGRRHGLFGEKYGERVRTVEVPGFSLELCGGCHVGNTGEIGLFLVTGERGIASGVRRVEAVTGAAALARVREREALLAAVGEALGGPAERAPEEIAALRADLAERDRELARLRMDLVAGRAGGAPAGEAVDVDGIRVLAREVPAAPAAELRNMADALRAKLGSGVVVLGTRDGAKVSLVAAVTPDLTGRVQAGRLVQALAALVGGGGGGRPDFAQAGGREPDKLPEALAAAPETVRELIS
jgi:alanyl-tRNA synthetase